MQRAIELLSTIPIRLAGPSSVGAAVITTDVAVVCLLQKLRDLQTNCWAPYVKKRGRSNALLGIEFVCE